MITAIPQLKLDDATWIPVKDGDPTGWVLFQRHYSKYHYKDGRKPSLFVGPGEKEVLITPDGLALFVWRKFISRDNQQGINCSVFRNEGPQLSSTLILKAEELAYKRWGKQRLYTYINSFKIKSSNPGYCFKKAGWRKCGITKVNKHIILEKLHG